MLCHGLIRQHKLKSFKHSNSNKYNIFIGILLKRKGLVVALRIQYCHYGWCACTDKKDEIVKPVRVADSFIKGVPKELALS